MVMVRLCGVWTVCCFSLIGELLRCNAFTSTSNTQLKPNCYENGGCKQQQLSELENPESTFKNPDVKTSGTTDVFREIGGLGIVKKYSENHGNDGQYTSICWAEIMTLKDYLNGSSDAVREYAIVLETPSDIPNNYLDSEEKEKQETLPYDVVDYDTKKSKTVNFTTIHKEADVTVRQNRKVICGSGPVYTKEYTEWPGSSRKRIEIKVSPKKKVVSADKYNLKEVPGREVQEHEQLNESGNNVDFLSTRLGGSARDATTSARKITDGPNELHNQVSSEKQHTLVDEDIAGKSSSLQSNSLLPVGDKVATAETPQQQTYKIRKDELETIEPYWIEPTYSSSITESTDLNTITPTQEIMKNDIPLMHLLLTLRKMMQGKLTNTVSSDREPTIKYSDQREIETDIEHRSDARSENLDGITLESNLSPISQPSDNVDTSTFCDKHSKHFIVVKVKVIVEHKSKSNTTGILKEKIYPIMGIQNGVQFNLDASIANKTERILRQTLHKQWDSFLKQLVDNYDLPIVNGTRKYFELPTRYLLQGQANKIQNSSLTLEKGTERMRKLRDKFNACKSYHFVNNNLLKQENKMTKTIRNGLSQKKVNNISFSSAVPARSMEGPTKYRSSVNLEYKQDGLPSKLISEEFDIIESNVTENLKILDAELPSLEFMEDFGDGDRKRDTSTSNVLPLQERSSFGTADAKNKNRSVIVTDIKRNHSTEEYIIEEMIDQQPSDISSRKVPIKPVKHVRKYKRVVVHGDFPESPQIQEYSEVNDILDETESYDSQRPKPTTHDKWDVNKFVEVMLKTTTLTPDFTVNYEQEKKKETKESKNDLDVALDTTTTKTTLVTETPLLSKESSETDYVGISASGSLRYPRRNIVDASFLAKVLNKLNFMTKKPPQ